jgi:hypothetical protein
MEEIEEIHTKSLEWGCVCNLLDKIAEIEEKIDGHWDELLDMLADMMAEESKEKDPANIFFEIYAFCFRLYYRIRTNPTKRVFNRVSKTNIAGKEVYRITNYDYKTFKWARTGGFMDGVSNDYMDLPADKLTTNQRRAFDRRIGDNK